MKQGEGDMRIERKRRGILRDVVTRPSHCLLQFITWPMVCSFSWFSLKKVGCPLRSKQNFFKAGGVGVSARGKIFGSRLAGIGGGLK